MKVRRNALISAAAALMSGLLVYSIYVLQLRGIEHQDSVRVVVPKRFVAAGERLGADDLTYKPLAGSAYKEGMLLDAEEAEGMEAVVPLGESEPVLKWKLDRYHLLPRETESTFQLPREYVLSVSNGIRAGDSVVIYVSGDNTRSSRLFPEEVTVASVKTSGNQEVDDMTNPNLLSLADGDKEKMYASRRNANGMIEFVNLNLTEEQWLKIDSLCKDGTNKLVIAYRPLTMGTEGEAEGGAP
ncbi:SAF domain-containing protein [Paenibacillus beijingensis]|uniref:Flagellar basal body P-ring biosynthesis protein FlgA n=1 Tax=Paenibacillus beijingensis TaxID=1126833 RepID=A0A0D5NFD7_9BACL|nr:SAF domain-containing protein [Paenibacillus beijingensis]AJY73860.1 flagellar basal body P-ring biosynthesis protein FlgA [Paenibacillus beijingensis]